MKAVRLGRAAGTRNMIKVAEDAENASILITGRSGAGKTVAMQKISQNIASDGGTVVMLSFHGTQSMIREDGIAVIDIRKEGLPFPILAPVCRPDGSKEDGLDAAGEVTDIFSDVLRLGAREKLEFQRAVQRAMEREDYPEDMEAIGRELIRLLEDKENGNKKVAGKIYDKFDSAFRQVRVSPMEGFPEPGKVTVLDLDGFSSLVQAPLADLILSVLWRYYRICGQQKEDMLFLACDEFQVLSLRPNSALNQILREGRKFHVAVLLATQTLERFGKKEEAVLLQAATQLYFRPAANEAGKILNRLGADKTNVWKGKLLGLQRGECIASGRLQIGLVVREAPLKMTFCI